MTKDAQADLLRCIDQHATALGLSRGDFYVHLVHQGTCPTADTPRLGLDACICSPVRYLLGNSALGMTPHERAEVTTKDGRTTYKVYPIE